MNTEPFFNRLNQVWDQAESPEHDPELQALCEEHPELRELLSSQQALAEGLRQIETPELSENFTQNVLTELNQTEVEQTADDQTVRIENRSSLSPDSLAPDAQVNRSGVLNLTWISVAAALLIVVWSSYFAWNQQNHLVDNTEKHGINGNTNTKEAVSPSPLAKDQHYSQTDQQPTVTPDVPPQVANNSNDVNQPTVVDNELVPTKDTPSMEELLAQMSEKYNSLATETRDSFSEVALLLPEVNFSQENMPMQPEKQTGWIPKVEQKIQPITDPVKKTLNQLWNVIPLNLNEAEKS